MVTGIIWLLLGVTGAMKKVADLVSRPVAVGIILGLGFGFMLEGIKMMNTGWLVTAAVAMWNIGLAFVIGVTSYHLLKRGLAKL